MDINIATPELISVVQSTLSWVEDYAKQLELSRRNTMATAAQTEKERKEIQELSEAFTYTVKVESDGNSFNVSIERVPPYEDNPYANDAARETDIILQSIIGEEISYSISNSEELKSLVVQQIEPQIIREISKTLGGDAS